MNPRQITVDLSTSGIKDLKKELKDYDKWLKKKSEELCEKLANLGVTRAQMYFAEALYDGINDVNVSAKRESDGYTVRASGTTVLFIELGTGIHYPDAPLGEYDGAGGMTHGSYGKGLGNNGYWFYTGQPGNAGGELAHGHQNSTITHGNPPNQPMYNTVKDLERELERVVLEVFK